jgi:hypothetical protein
MLGLGTLVFGFWFLVFGFCDVKDCHARPRVSASTALGRQPSHSHRSFAPLIFFSLIAALAR